VADNDKTIVSRIQHRRGLKQDLPQPLRPGEIGLATDSRQLYIGGDPTNPATADYHSVSYYENTLSAKDHVSSIANNNIIAFNVPCVRFVEGEFNGSSKVKSWQPTDSRSIIGGVVASAYSDSTYPVFSAVSTATIVSNLSATKPAGSFEIQVANIAGTDDTGNIRVNDEIIISGYSGTRPKVNTVAKHTSGYYVITIDRTGVAEGVYQGSVEFSSNAGIRTLLIDYEELPSGVSEPNAGKLYTLLYNVETEEVEKQVSSVVSSGEYTFSISDVSAGVYALITGSDINNDSLICGPGEVCAVWPTMEDPDYIFANQALTGLTLNARYLSQIQGEASALDVSSNSKLKKIPSHRCSNTGAINISGKLTIDSCFKRVIKKNTYVQ